MTERAAGQPRVERPRCPYCHDQIVADDGKAGCRACMAWHHEECWFEGGGCAACGRVADAASGAAVAAPPPPRAVFCAPPRRPERGVVARVAGVGVLVPFLIGAALSVATSQVVWVALLPAVFLLGVLLWAADDGGRRGLERPFAELGEDLVRFHRSAFGARQVAYEHVTDVTLSGERGDVLLLRTWSGNDVRVPAGDLDEATREELVGALRQRIRRAG